MPQYSIYTVDAFADKPFAGNQAGVVPVPSAQPVADHTMQALAAEMNISETTFLTATEHQGDSEFQRASKFSLRWFTPTVEVTLCGHATLAAAHVLVHELGNQNPEIRFETLSGVLIVRVNANGQLDMTFPADVPEPVVANNNIKLLAQSVFGEYSDAMEIALSPVLRYLVVHDPRRTAQDVASLVPDITPAIVAAGREENVMIVIATARGTGADFVSRVFGPWCGVDEDPVTGSAHTVLAPFWEQRLGKSSFSALQCSKRGGTLGVQVAGAQVVVSGTAVVVIRGTLSLD
ncbi:hypothetical protein IWW50_000659 [Coemansia erecta]|nr:hypothetical protein IWW50_000659 [Coemansia erecta]